MPPADLLHLLGLLGMDGLQQHTLVLVDVTWVRGLVNLI